MRKDGGRKMIADDRNSGKSNYNSKSEFQPPRPKCACTLGPRRSWTVVFLGIILVLLAVSLDLSVEAVLIIGLLPLAVLVASAASGRRRT